MRRAPTDGTTAAKEPMMKKMAPKKKPNAAYQLTLYMNSNH